MVGSAYLNKIPIQGGKIEEKGNTDWKVAQCTRGGGKPGPVSQLVHPQHEASGPLGPSYPLHQALA